MATRTLPDLNEALRGVAAEKLDKQCSRDDLDEISKSLTRWPEVSPFLGLTEADEEEVKDGQALRRQRVDVLRRWRKNQKERATYRWVEFEPHMPLKFEIILVSDSLVDFSACLQLASLVCP